MGYVESSFASQAEALGLFGLRVQQSLASLSLQMGGHLKVVVLLKPVRTSPRPGALRCD